MNFLAMDYADAVKQDHMIAMVIGFIVGGVIIFWLAVAFRAMSLAPRAGDKAPWYQEMTWAGFTHAVTVSSYFIAFYKLSHREGCASDYIPALLAFFLVALVNGAIHAMSRNGLSYKAILPLCVVAWFAFLFV